MFVTGATGTVGSALVELLLARGERVVVGVRDDGATSRVPPDAEARPFRFGDAPVALEGALRGADRLFLLRPPAIADVEAKLFPVVDAARRVGVRHVVFLSLQGVQVNRRTPHHAVEAYLRASGAPWTFLRPNLFMQNFTSTYAAEIRERDRIFVPAGRALTAFVDARDVARVAAAVFTSPGHVRRAYTLSGEQSLSYRHVARLLSEVLGRPIRYSAPSEDEYLAHLATQGLPRDYLEVQRMIHRVVRLNVSALPNRSVRRLTGTPATTFRRFAEDHAALWRPEG